MFVHDFVSFWSMTITFWFDALDCWLGRLVLVASNSVKSKSYFERKDSSKKMRFTRSCNESNEAHSWEEILVSQQHADAQSPDNFEVACSIFLVLESWWNIPRFQMILRLGLRSRDINFWAVLRCWKALSKKLEDRYHGGTLEQPRWLTQIFD